MTGKSAPSGGDGPEATAVATAIEKEEEGLRRLAAELADTEARLAELRSKLPVPLSVREELSSPPPAAPRSPAEKVRLFGQLFRGRDDLYPTRFVSKKTGKAGYAPACSNKFVAGVCELPKVKCGDCTNQAFRPVDDAALLQHLRGQHVMGVYPMLTDETCWFLAADFDKTTWKEDVRALMETARRLGLPALVERSRSGNGAHVWFFFSEPVPAATARKMGCYLITEAMASRHELAMDSYDRLFPSQDTMPRGGFGNLIALPLQHGPRQLGYSVFLDEEMNAYPDDQQWSVLAAVRRIDPATVDRIATDAALGGTILGIRTAEAADDDEDAMPWTRAPSGAPRIRRVPGPMPARMSAVLAQRLFIAKEGVSSPLLNQIKRLAAFQNPEFYKRQSMRLSTATTPRVISCAEDLPQHVALPRGCRTGLEELLRHHGVVLDIVDERMAGEALDLRFRGTLTKVQEAAARALLAHDTGLFVAPPGVGKTVIGTYLVASRACSTLTLALREQQRRPPLLERVNDVVQDCGIPRLVARELLVEALDPLVRLGCRRAEGRLAHDEAVLERTRRRLRFRVDLEAHGAELHLDDRLVPVAALGSRREADDVASLHLSEDTLELHGR